MVNVVVYRRKGEDIESLIKIFNEKVKKSEILDKYDKHRYFNSRRDQTKK